MPLDFLNDAEERMGLVNNAVYMSIVKRHIVQ